MAINITTLNIRIVRETSGRYDLDSRIMNSPSQIARLMDEVFDMEHQAQEIMVLLCLDTKNKITGVFQISQGTLNASLVHPRDVFQRALLQNSNSIILVHNHPSGDPTPSNEDITINDRITDAGELLGIRLLDHMIMGNGRFISFRQEGLM